MTLPQVRNWSRWHFNVCFLNPLVLWLCLRWPKHLGKDPIQLLVPVVKMVGWTFSRHSSYWTVSRKKLLLGQTALWHLIFSWRCQAIFWDPVHIWSAFRTLAVSFCCICLLGPLLSNVYLREQLFFSNTTEFRRSSRWHCLTILLLKTLTLSIN